MAGQDWSIMIGPKMPLWIEPRENGIPFPRFPLLKSKENSDSDGVSSHVVILVALVVGPRQRPALVVENEVRPIREQSSDTFNHRRIRDQRCVELELVPEMAATTSVDLEAELDFFERRRLDLFREAPGKFALVKGARLLGVYDTELEAVRHGFKTLGNESFLVKQIVEADVPLVFTTFNLGV